MIYNVHAFQYLHRTANANGIGYLLVAYRRKVCHRELGTGKADSRRNASILHSSLLYLHGISYFSVNHRAVNLILKPIFHDSLLTRQSYGGRLAIS